jgi:hypothetical protein
MSPLCFYPPRRSAEGTFERSARQKGPATSRVAYRRPALGRADGARFLCRKAWMLCQLSVTRVHGFRHGADQDHFIRVKRRLASFGFEHRVALADLRPAEHASPGCACRDNAPVLRAAVTATRVAPVDHQEVGLGPLEQQNATLRRKTQCRASTGVSVPRLSYWSPRWLFNCCGRCRVAQRDRMPARIAPVFRIFIQSPVNIRGRRWPSP